MSGNLIPNILYRGAKIKSGVNSVSTIRSAGIFTNLAKGGDPVYIKKIGIIEAILQHIAPQKIKKELLKGKSHFLSFSSDCKIAKCYASDKSSDNILINCGDENSIQRYIVTLNIDGQFLIFNRINGVYTLEYDCDLSLCEFCIKTEKKIKHKLLLFDVVTLLSSHPEWSNDTNALLSAERDKEWLVMPFDFLSNLAGESARMSPSNIWTVAYYKFA